MVLPIAVLWMLYLRLQRRNRESRRGRFERFHQQQRQSPLSNAFCEFVFRHNLFQEVNFPTHIKGNILDLVLSNSADTIENISCLSFRSLSSDHYFVSFSVPTALNKFSKQSNPYFFNFKKLISRVCSPFCWTLILVFSSLQHILSFCGFC